MMATIKMTFSLDEATARRLEQSASRLSRPKSQVVREAIHEYSARAGRMSREETLRMLQTFDEVVPAIPKRSANDVKEELAEIRRARRQGGRRSPPDAE